MTEPYPSTSSTRSPIHALPELKPAKKTAHPLLVPSVIVLAALLVATGWYLLPGNAPATANPEATTSPSTGTWPAAQPSPDQAEPSSGTNPSEAALAAYRGDSREPGLRHITTLQLAGAYAQAAEFAVAAPLDHRRDFTIAAYHEWGRHQPDLALASAIRIEEAFTRDFAMHSVLSGWARNDPEGLAEAALAFPDSDFKKAALKRALRAWMIKDPNVAGDWILARPEVVPVAEELFRRDRRD